MYSGHAELAMQNQLICDINGNINGISSSKTKMGYKLYGLYGLYKLIQYI